MPKKKTTEEFIIDAISKHGNEFDYSKVIYKGNKEKVIIICKEHGEFLIRPNDHLNGVKCPKCSGNYHRTTADFIEEATLKFNHKYDYSKTIYSNNKTDIIIICPTHGEFKQTPEHHLNSPTGCPKCSAIERGLSARLTKSDFLIRSIKQHGNRYLYHKVEYSLTSVPVVIVCRQHGEFRQTPETHMNGCGCPICKNIKVGRSLKLSLEEFIYRSSNIHNFFYMYPRAKYLGNDKKICITCPIHGDFIQTAAHHMKGHGCPKCKGEKNRERLLFTTEDFIRMAKEKHGDRYDYSKVVYISSRDKVCIICKEHGEFWQTAGLHLSGANCSKCTGTFMDKDMFVEKAEKVHKYLYSYGKTDYVNTETPVIIICKEHGEFLQTPHRHLQGQGCPICAQSTGELLIYNNLKRKNILVETQKKFKACKYEKVLPFDFYLPKYDLLIEYHGEQHYEYIEFFHKNYNGFLFRQQKDKIKKDYAEKHHNFLEIPYWEFHNIEKILEEKIKQLDKQS